MKRLFKRRREDLFRTGKAAGFRSLLRSWLSFAGAGIGGTRRTDERPDRADSAHKRATGTAEGPTSPPPVPVAKDQPGDIGLYLALKKREQQKGFSVRSPGSRKAADQ